MSTYCMGNHETKVSVSDQSTTTFLCSRVVGEFQLGTGNISFLPLVVVLVLFVKLLLWMILGS